MSQTTGTAIDTALIDQHIGAYKKAHQGKLTDAQIQENVNALTEALTAAAKQLAAQTTYSANAGISFLVDWVHIGVRVNGGKNCIGDGGGVFTVAGGGAFWGDVYTGDVEKLYRDTVSFQANVTPFYANVNFFDANSNLLGHFHGGGLCIGGGIGGGKCKWA